MPDRHLRPDEIEQLLDGEEGFGVAPLRDHVAGCAVCQHELEGARALMQALDSLPDFAPSAGFADRVMQQVQVFEPWHVAATRTVASLVPARRSARIAAGIGVAVTAGLATAGATWAVARADMAVVLTQLGLERFREQVLAAGHDLLTTVIGHAGVASVQASSPELLALTVGGFVATAGLGVVGIRALASTSRR